MDALIQKKYFIGKSIAGVWSSVYTYKPQNPDIRRTRGEIFAVIALKGPKEFALATAGNMLLDNFHEKYFENQEDSVMIAIEKALLDTNRYLQRFLENDVNGSQGVELDIITLSIIEDLVYIVAMGGGKAFVYRDALLSDITDALKDPTGEAMLSEVSFIAKKGDVYLLGTPKLDAEIKNNEIEEVVSEFTEKPLKNRMFKNEAEIAVLMVGLNIERTNPMIMPPQAFPDVEQDAAVMQVENQEELYANDAAAVTWEVAQEIDAQATEPLQPNLYSDNTLGYDGVVAPENEQTLEELFHDELIKEDFPIKEEQNPEVDLVEEDDLEEVLIEETSDVQTQEDMRFPKVGAGNVAKPVVALGLFAKLSLGAKGLVTKGKSAIGKLGNRFKAKIPNRKQVAIIESSPDNSGYDAEPLPYKDDELELTDTAHEEFVDLNNEEPQAQPPQVQLEVIGNATPEKVAQKIVTPAKNTAEMKTYQVVLFKIGTFFKKIFGGIKGLVWDKWLGMGVDNNNIYLKTAARKRKWGLLVVIILVIGCVLYLSVNNMVVEQKTKAVDEKTQTYLTEAKQLVADVEKNVSLYARMPADDARKQVPLKTLSDAEAKLTQAASNRDLANDIATVRTNIAAIKDKMSAIIPEPSPNLVLDLAAKYPNANITDMVVVNKTIYMTDSANNAVFSSDYAGNLKQVASGLQSPRSITADDKGNLIVMDANTDKGLSIIDPKTGTVNRMAATSQAKIGGATQLDFTMVNKEGRLYLLNPQQKAVYYYSRSGSSYSTIQKRLGFDELATAKDIMVIDGRFYFLLKKNIGLMRYFDKAEDPINLKGLAASANLFNASAIYVDGTTVYINDPTSKSLFIFKKDTPDITLIAQYAYRGTNPTDWTTLQEVQADRESGKIFLLDKNKVFSVSSEKLNDFQ